MHSTFKTGNKAVTQRCEKRKKQWGGLAMMVARVPRTDGTI